MEHTLIIIVYFALLNLVIVLIGYVFLKEKMVLQSWVMLILSILLICFIFRHEHPIIKMLAIIATTFSGIKVIAVTASYRGKGRTLTFKQWLTFAIGWVGMRAQPFESLGEKPVPGGWQMIRFGISRVIGGAMLILIAHLIAQSSLNHTLMNISVSILLLIGFSLILHFGFLGISAGAWRLSGVNAYFLFRSPAKSLRLTEFWSKRWNLAFSEMTAISIFRPLKNKTGPPIALMIAFIFSGLLHELALSVPVNNGYGLPMLYFIIQGSLVLIEKVLTKHNPRFLGNNVIARVWTLFWVVAPAPLLFHYQFIKEVVWPLAGLKY